MKKVVFSIGIVTIMVLFAMFFVVDSQKDASRHGFLLSPPPFVHEVLAATSGIGTELDEEAGISAWYDGAPIDLNAVDSVFTTIEIQTTEYIIGSVQVSNYTDLDHFDAHCYVHVDGWILCYYPYTDHTAKIIDVRAKTISSTKFTTVLSSVASAAGIPFTPSAENYYDFRYPNATNMLFVAEDYLNGNSFQVQVPSTYGYSERGWAIFDGYPNDGVQFYWDGVNLPNQIWTAGNLAYGNLTTAQVLADTLHTASVPAASGSYGVVVITYSVP